MVLAGFDWNLNPSALLAAHVMLALHRTSSPVEPLGLVTGPGLVTGRLHRMSKPHVAGTDAGLMNRNSAFGMLKKSNSARFAALICAVPAPNITSTATGEVGGSIQNKPPGYGLMPGSKSWTWVEKSVKSY